MQIDKNTKTENIASRIEKILRLVQNPQRYIDGEIGSVRKSHEGKLTYALAFPEPYELAMSHTGFRILYHLINSNRDFVAERVFCPGEDMIELMHDRQIPLFSMESKKAVSNFDVLGFSLQTELSFSNILIMLELAGIPLRREERDESHPIIMAGGPSAFNPEPMAGIIDVFYIGDAEANLIEALEIINRNKERSRIKIYKELVKLDGIYIPEFYEPKYEDDNFLGFEIANNAPERVRKAIKKELSGDIYPQQPIVPWMEIVHDRYGLEIMRGCSRGCRFCMAGYIYRPVRERPASEVIEEAKQAIDKTGMEELGLLSLSTTDYVPFLDVMSKLKVFSQKHHLSLSVPSIRPEAFGEAFFNALATERKGGLTLAPEAATPRLRAVINKYVDMDELAKTIEKAVSMGWKRVKFYFMIGLPTETDDDVLAIIDVAEMFSKILRRVNGRLKVSISPFVPKAHTPFQWEEQNSPQEIQRKQDLLYDALKGRKIRLGLDTRNTFTSYLEGIFARGDRKLGKVLIKAFELGAKFDAWDDIRDEDAWHKAFEETGINPMAYLGERDLEMPLPWQIIDTGVKPETLINERKKAYSTKYTKDCREIRCENCQKCSFDKMIIADTKYDIQSSSTTSSTSFGRSAKRKARRDAFAMWNFVRIEYSRFGELRFLSHLDMGRIIRRTIRRSNLPVAYTQGYHKHEKIAFGPPLPIGYSSTAEYVDIHLDHPTSEDKFMKFFRQFPKNIEVTGQKFLTAKSKIKSLAAAIEKAQYAIILNDEVLEEMPIDTLQKKLEEIHEMEKIEFQRRKKVVDIRPLFHGFRIFDNVLVMFLELSNNGSGRPGEYLEFIGISHELAYGVEIIRTDMLIKRGSDYYDPFDNKVEPLSEKPDLKLIK
ncbi:MAG: TIGR03960 family B12-binding radical SAM protein [Candidatus Zixiibacteriota bacterium]